MRKALQERPDNELEKLILTQAEFEEAKVEEHEIKVHGKMYDIARVRAEGDKLKIFCLHDAKEDNLIAFLDELVTRPIDKTNSMATSAFQFLSLIFIVPAGYTSIFLVVLPIEIEIYYLLNLTESLSIPLSPPPWRFSM